MKYYLGVDLGTTGTKTLLFNDKGEVLGKGYQGYGLITPDDKIYEQSPEAWYDAVITSVKLATQDFKGEIDGLSVSAQGGSFVFCNVDSSGQLIPLTNAITWLDRRAGVEADELKEEISKISKMRVGERSVIAKLLWFKKYKPEIVEKTKIILSTSDYIYYKLTGKAAIDYTSAAMMGVFDNDNLCWNDQLLSVVGFDKSKFPSVLSPGDFIGNAGTDFLSKTGLYGDIKVICGIHDQFSASLGANYFSSGDLIVSTGTTWVVFARNEEKKSGIFAGRKHPDGGYGYFISAVSSGTVLEWTKNAYGTTYKEIDALAELKPIDKDLMVFPFISGNGGYRGANIHSYGAQGVAFKHEKGDIFRATMEGVAFEIKYIVDLYRQSGFNVNNVIVTGGATRSGIWMKILSDVLGEKLYLSEQADGCCFGAYSVAKKGSVGSFERFEFAGEIVEPNLENTKIYKEKFEKYNEILERK